MGHWEVGGETQGRIACYQDRSGAAILYWSHTDSYTLVTAINQNGDAAALYEWFQQNARWIAP